jgi:hypothetical protein
MSEDDFSTKMKYWENEINTGNRVFLSEKYCIFRKWQEREKI